MCRDILMSGRKVVYEPAAEVVHCHERNLRQEFQWAVDNAISMKRLGLLDNPAMGSEFRYGLERIRADWRYFTGRRMYGCAVRGLVFSAAKWAGVQLGKRHDALPSWLLRRIPGGTNRKRE